MKRRKAKKKKLKRRNVGAGQRALRKRAAIAAVRAKTLRLQGHGGLITSSNQEDKPLEEWLSLVAPPKPKTDDVKERAALPGDYWRRE